MRAESGQNNFEYVHCEILPHGFCLLESEQNVRNVAWLYIQDIHRGEKTMKGYHFYLIKSKGDGNFKTSSGH